MKKQWKRKQVTKFFVHFLSLFRFIIEYCFDSFVRVSDIQSKKKEDGNERARACSLEATQRVYRSISRRYSMEENTEKYTNRDWSLKWIRRDENSVTNFRAIWANSHFTLNERMSVVDGFPVVWLFSWRRFFFRFVCIFLVTAVFCVCQWTMCRSQQSTWCVRSILTLHSIGERAHT